MLLWFCPSIQSHFDLVNVIETKLFLCMFIKLGTHVHFVGQRSRSWVNVGVCVDGTLCVALLSMHSRLND